MRIEVATDIPAPRQRVWDLLVDWDRQADWMVDAVDVEVVTPDRRGEGVTVRCPTRLLGVVVEDVLRVTRWEPPAVLEAVHLGRVIRGRGGFELSEEGGGTLLVWWEEVPVPFGALGERLAAVLVRPYVRWTFGRSLRRLAALAEGDMP